MDIDFDIKPDDQELYVAYYRRTVQPNGAIGVRKYSGGTWSQVGSEINIDYYANGVILKFHPVTYEPYISFGHGLEGIFVYKYNSTGGMHWISIISIPYLNHPMKNWIV